MLRLNRMTDYAILVLGVLHGRPDVLLSSAQIAQHAQLTQATAAKIIKALGSAGLVTTIRGTKGGCQLALPASAISIADVIEAIEGPIALTACVEGAEDPCSVQQGCFMSGSWNHINGAIRSALDGVSLSDLFSPSNMFPARLETPKTSSQTGV
ncbi:MAG: SUF system Fe-S cluster assembly regulator [Candidatus Puniceispirillaceae bacterium]